MPQPDAFLHASRLLQAVADDPLCLQLPLPALLLRLAPCSAGPDFTSLLWNGIRYTFSPTQRAIVRQLYEAWRTGHPDVGQETLLAGANSDGSSVADLFRRHPAWSVAIIASPTKGAYRLSDPSIG
jgi:hypothetical protein